MPLESVIQLPGGESVSAAERGHWGAVAKPTRLGDQLCARMAELIERGEFSDGSRLPAEIDLADRFGVSRPVIREALSRLRVMGVIVSRKGSGSYVQKRNNGAAARALAVTGFGPVNSLAEVKKCYEFRIGFEGEAAYYAAQNRTPETLRLMRAALDRMEMAVAHGLVGMSADFEFHLAVARASGNEFFEAVMQSMRLPIEFAINLARSLSLTRPIEHLRIVQTEHVEMFEAIEAGDKDAARRAMRAHVEGACWRVFEGPGSQAQPPNEGGAGCAPL
jgi:GntR family transcriptional regulator, transcriptional repressor for pyruvate dehydrogenase complex